MKKVKIIILLIMLLILTSACSANYELEFKDKNLYESITIVANTNSMSQTLKSDFEKYKQYYIPSIVPDGNYNEDYTKKVNEITYYENQHTFNDEEYTLGYRYNYSIKNYGRAYLPKYGVEYFNFIDNGKTYVLSTSTNFKIFNEYSSLDSINVHIKSNHKLVETNADRVDGYNYYWLVNRGASKNIYLEVEKNKYVFNYENGVLKTIAIVGLIIIIIGIISLHLYMKAKRLNRV